jgi:hypothetical protein
MAILEELFLLLLFLALYWWGVGVLANMLISMVLSLIFSILHLWGI